MGIKLLSLSPFLKEKAHFLQGIYIINIGSVSSIKHCIIWQFLSGHKALWVYWPLSPSQTWLVATHWAPPTQRRCPAGQWITVQDRSSVPSPQSSSPSQIQPAWIQRPVPQVNSCKYHSLTAPFVSFENDKLSVMIFSHEKQFHAGIVWSNLQLHFFFFLEKKIISICCYCQVGVKHGTLNQPAVSLNL